MVESKENLVLKEWDIAIGLGNEGLESAFAEAESTYGYKPKGLASAKIHYENRTPFQTPVVLLEKSDGRQAALFQLQRGYGSIDYIMLCPVNKN